MTNQKHFANTKKVQVREYSEGLDPSDLNTSNSYPKLLKKQDDTICKM